MAYYNKGSYLERSYNELFDKVWRPGKEVEQSGIYICTSCGKEVACNEGTPFPPQNDHQHDTDDPIRWKLIVATSNLEDDED